MTEQQPSLEEIKQQCIFCQIIGGQVPSKQVFADEKLIGILDINPASPGHILLMTKEHYAVLPQMPEEDINHLGMVVKALSEKLISTFNADGTTVFIANGVAAGQRAHHFMAHLIPRKEGDEVGLILPSKKLPEADMKKIKEALQPRINKHFGVETKEEAAPEKVEESKEKKSSIKKESKKKQDVEPKKDLDLDTLTDMLTK